MFKSVEETWGNMPCRKRVVFLAVITQGRFVHFVMTVFGRQRHQSVNTAQRANKTINISVSGLPVRFVNNQDADGRRIQVTLSGS